MQHAFHTCLLSFILYFNFTSPIRSFVVSLSQQLLLDLISAFNYNIPSTAYQQYFNIWLCPRRLLEKTNGNGRVEELVRPHLEVVIL